jgi:small subunit ribosomal protein S21
MGYNKGNFNKGNFKKTERPSGMTVIVRDNDVSKALRVLKKKLLADGFFQELRERTFYESKGTKRRHEKEAAIRRSKRKLQKIEEENGF